MQAWIAAELRGRIFVWVASESHVLAAKQTGKKKKKLARTKTAADSRSVWESEYSFEWQFKNSYLNCGANEMSACAVLHRRHVNYGIKSFVNNPYH